MSIFDSIKRLFGGAPAPAGHGQEDGAGACPASADEGQMISCEEALRLVHDFLDGELVDVPAAQVKKHFDVCSRCYPHLKLESAYREAIRRASRCEEAPDALKARVSQRLAEVRAED